METNSVNNKKSVGMKIKSALFLGLLTGFSSSVFAQGAVEKAEEPSIFSNPMFVAMISVVILLLIVIMIFADVAKNAIRNKSEQDKKAKGENASTIVKAILAIVMIGGFSTTMFAQDPASAAAATAAVEAVSAAPASVGYWGMDAMTFFSMLTIISFELFVAWRLYVVALQQLGVAERKKLAAAARKKEKFIRPSLIDKMNASVAIEKEGEIMMDHDYDGIKELDNNLPPWWIYGFYFTIIFAVVYLFHFHVTHTGKLQLAEYNEQIEQGKRDVEAYRKKAANLVDENNATALTDGGSLAAGKATFSTNCAACHGANGEGGVGPNLTDDFWIHQGDIKDIFKTIKYGYPEKGMKSWEQDLGARQIHEVASYVKSLKGTNPANAKAKEGELYVEKGAKAETADTTKTVK
jgi:cytochrome c oxidase cbb3-type subunit III